MIYAEQNTVAGKYLRSFKRGQWRTLARMERMAIREANKALEDMLIYGEGFVRFDEDGAHHVPAAGVRL